MNTEILQPPVNGSAPQHDEPAQQFPVGSFAEAAQHLRRPFTANAVKWKVQSKYGDGGLVVAYIDARLVIERLNLVCPAIWHEEFEVVDGGLMCHLTIGDITRRDIGTGYQQNRKGLYSDAFKRAAVKFGVGASLYAIPQQILDVGDGLRRGKNADQLFLTKIGEDRCRDAYRKWLGEDGASFGEPLDHGDSEGSVGDVEMIEAPESEAGAVTDVIAKQIVDRAWKVADAKSNFQLAVSHQLREDCGDCSTKPKATAAVKMLDLAQAEKLSEWVSKKEAGANG